MVKVKVISFATFPGINVITQSVPPVQKVVASTLKSAEFVAVIRVILFILSG